MARMPFIGGSAEPHSEREPWPLRLTRDEAGAEALMYDSPGQTQPIFGIHESLRPLLSKLPAGVELSYLCRVADGQHYNVRNLIAVSVEAGFERVAEHLDDAFVQARPQLRLARASQRLKSHDEVGAVDALGEGGVGRTVRPMDGEAAARGSDRDRQGHSSHWRE